MTALDAAAVVKLLHQHHLLARRVYVYGMGHYVVLVTRDKEEYIIRDRSTALSFCGYHFSAQVDIT